MELSVVYLYVFDGMSDWEAAYVTAGINNPQFQKNPGRYCIKTVATSHEPIKSMGGLTIIPDMTLDEIFENNCAMLILPGGESWDQGKNNESLEMAKKILDSGKPVAAICGATAGLARAGLLDTRKHTSNAKIYLEMTEYNGNEYYEDAAAITDQNVITAPGTAPVDFAYHIFKILDLQEVKVLEAWYGLFKTGDPKYFGELMQAVSE